MQAGPRWQSAAWSPERKMRPTPGELRGAAREKDSAHQERHPRLEHAAIDRAAAGCIRRHYLARQERACAV